MGMVLEVGVGGKGGKGKAVGSRQAAPAHRALKFLLAVSKIRSDSSRLQGLGRRG